VKKGFWFCVKGSLGFLVLISVMVYCFAPQLVALFRDDPAVIAYGARALRFQCLTFPMQSWVVMSNMMQQVTGKTVPATFLAVARQGLFFIPAVLILRLVLGDMGIQLAQPTADILTFCCAVPLQLFIMKRLPKQDEVPLEE